MRDREPPLALWMLAVAVIALMSAPAGLTEFAQTALPTRIFYVVLTLAGAALVGTGVWLWFAKQPKPAVLWAGFGAAAVLAVNQAAGLALDSILCFTPT
jgi:hypothetical protein